VDTRSGPDELDAQILDALTKLIEQMIAYGEKIAQSFAVPSFCVKALHMLDASMAMKDLGRRMHCDPSFVTAIADTLEKRGLARREPSSADRRIKNLILSAEGAELKQRIEGEMLAHMAWNSALDTQERQCLLGLLRKMSQYQPGETQSDQATTTPPTMTGGQRAGEVSEALSSLLPSALTKAKAGPPASG
jgi:DNA-binding MarR family transcriptional regulator